MSGKFALVIGNTKYNDPGLAQLTAPGKDTEEFARVLEAHDICAFDEVKVLLDETEPVVREAIDEFFEQKKPEDLLVLYFSGHGVRDENGSLYLAVKNTNRFRLRSTAIKSDFIREAMDQSRSNRQVLILDCCNSGAFAQGTKAATGVSIGTKSAFEGKGYGHVVLTASDAIQFAWEGNTVIGETNNSLFTHFLVRGLEGEADSDGDGRITIDELYEYAYEQIVNITPKQTPGKWSYKQKGEIVLRHSTPVEDIKLIALPPYLINAIENPDSDVRLGAVQSLAKLLTGKNIGLARSAREALERIEKEDDSRRVIQVATQTLEPIREQELQEKLRAEQIARAIIQRTARAAQHSMDSIREEERLAAEKVAAEQKAKQESERLLAVQKAEGERKARAEEERLAILKAEATRKADEEARRLFAAQKAEQERLARERVNAERESVHKEIKRKSTAVPILSILAIGAVVIITAVIGFFLLLKLMLPSGNENNNPPIPTRTQTPSSGDVLLRDDFSSIQWANDTDADSSVEYANQALQMILFKKNYFVWATPNNQDYENVNMEVTVINNGTDSTTAFGLMCHQQPEANNSFYYFAMTPAGEYAIGKAMEGQKDVFLTNNDAWAPSDLIAKNASSYRVGADCGNGTLTLYVDGQKITSVSDASYTGGGVGLFTWSGENATTTNVSFDDFLMTQLP